MELNTVGKVVVVLLFYVHDPVVMSERSVNLTILFLGRLRPPVNQYLVHILSPVTDNCPSSISGKRNESMRPDRVSYPGPVGKDHNDIFYLQKPIWKVIPMGLVNAVVKKNGCQN